MNNEREKLESPIIRHGPVEGISKYIEEGEKPPYDLYVKFMEGKIDPPVDFEKTVRLIEEKIRSGKVNPESFDIIISSPFLRAVQTAELIKKLSGSRAKIITSEFLREPKISMSDITRDFYENAENIKQIISKFIESFLDGKKNDEDVVEIYRGAERFLKYLKEVKKRTSKNPIFITHGIKARFINLALNHERENLSDDKVKEIIKKELRDIRRPSVIEGYVLETTETGTNLKELI